MTIEASSGVVKNNNRSVKVSVHVGRLVKKKACKRNHLKSCANNNSNSNRRRHEQGVVVSRTLQRLFGACKNVFNGPGTVSSPEQVQILRRILDDMKPEDVGLSRDQQFFRPKNESEGTQRVTSSTIYKCENFELSIFFLPRSAVIPLHNHPEMTVFSKLLLGTMHVKSYDWVDDDPHHSIPSSLSNHRLAKLNANREFTSPCDASVLYPTSGGNIHEFRAITPCAVLDVIGPPYSKENGRDSSYYRDTPCHAALHDKEDGDSCSYGWLEEIEAPNESEMDGIEYMGPQIIDSQF